MNYDASSHLTVASFLALWLAHMQTTLRPSTYGIYQSTVKLHIVPVLGNVRLLEVNSSSCEQLIESLQASNLKAKTIGGIVRKFQQALDWGTKEKLCPLIGLGLRIHLAMPVSQEPTILSKEQQNKLNEYLIMDIDESKLGVLLCLHSGLMVGEVCALRWEDFDLKNKTIRVNKIIQRIYKDNISTVMTQDSPLHYAPIPEFIIQVMPWLPTRISGLFLESTCVEYIAPRTMQMRLKRYAEECGLDGRLTFTIIRETFLKNCMESGMDFIEISHISGLQDLNALWRRYGKYYRRVVG